jgi:hypothetical protein
MLKNFFMVAYPKKVHEIQTVFKKKQCFGLLAWHLLRVLFASFITYVLFANFDLPRRPQQRCYVLQYYSL